jgi:FkbM family methyltransferase
MDRKLTLRRLLKEIYSSMPFKGKLFSLIKSIYRPSHEVYQHLHFKGWFRVKAEMSYFWMYHHGYEVENEIFWKGLHGWEKTSLSVWMKLTTISDIIFDIGANTGIYALISGSVNKNSKVFAYEPVKRVYEKLDKNIRKNQFDIIAEEVAISNFSGTATIYDRPTDHIYSVTVNKNLAGFEAAVIPTTVSVKTLSDIIKENKLEKIDLIKIDVETHEPEVLQGMSEYLGLFKPMLLIEVLTEDVAEGINILLGKVGYKYYKVYESKGLREMEKIVLDPTDGYNFLAVPIEKENVMRHLGIETLTKV